MGGGAWLAASLAASGQTHVFFVDAVLRRTLLALSEAGVARVFHPGATRDEIVGAIRDLAAASRVRAEE